MSVLEIPTARWMVPLLPPARYKGARGGRGSGKSHGFAEMAVERMVCEPDLSVVFIREIQKTLQHSSKRLLELKLQQHGVSGLFDSTKAEITRREGRGLCIFQGMRDHTADSIKSLEDFDLAIVEEAQNLSRLSLELLLPTIRKPGSEIWFLWNPDQPTDPVDEFLRGPNKDPDAVVVEANWNDNPFLPDVLRREMEKHRVRNPQTFNHVWEGGYAIISEAQIFAGKCVVKEFTPGKDWDGPYHGLDFGFASDPTAAVKIWLHGDRVFIERDACKHALELDDTAAFLESQIPGISKHKVRADNARPESISYLKRHGLPMVEACEKGKGSVEDGISHLRSYAEIVIHPRCETMRREAQAYRYKIDRMSGDILPEIVDKDNHCWDAARYALEPVMKRQQVDYATIL